MAGLLLATVAVGAFGLAETFHIATIGSQFGEIPRGLPSLHLPVVDFALLPEMIQPAFTIAMLVAMQALLCAVVTDGILDERHDSNQELVGQGVANLVGPLFGCIPVTGAVARSVVNARSGARTPVAGLVHSALLLVLLVAAAPLLSHIPLATLSAVLVVAAYRMVSWRQFLRLTRWPFSDSSVFLATFALTVLTNLTLAVEVGVVLAALLMVKRIAETSQITAVDESTETEGLHHSLMGRQVPPGVLIFRVFGAFFFGVVDKLDDELKRVKQEPEILILRVRKVLAMDATGLQALEDLHAKLRAKGKHLILSAAHTQPLMVMENAGFLDRLGRENVCRTSRLRSLAPVRFLACRRNRITIRCRRSVRNWKPPGVNSLAHWSAAIKFCNRPQLQVADCRLPRRSPASAVETESQNNEATFQRASSGSLSQGRRARRGASDQDYW